MTLPLKATRTDRRGTARNGLARFHDYAYRGIKTELKHACLAGCGRRMDTLQVCAVCRGYFDRADGKARPGEATRRRETRRLCGATDGLSLPDGPYGRCQLPAGHDGDWHLEERDGEVWANWRGPHPGQRCNVCGKDGSEH